jgi:hypothetical protein
MFNKESQTIRAWLHDLAKLELMVSVASGNRAMREVHQPFIHANVFAPLTSRGVKCLHHELHSAEGVDLVGDLLEKRVQTEIKALKPDLILCCNLIEHVTDRHMLAQALAETLSQGGFLLLTVPKSFQYHADPIDTYYRPTPEQLIELFPDFSVVRSEILVVESMLSDMRGSYGLGTLAHHLMRHMTRLVTLIPQYQRWLSHMHSSLWLIRRRKVTMLLLRRN